MKATFVREHDKFSYAYKLDDVEAGFHKAPFGRQLDDWKKIKAFKENAKSTHVGAKRKATLAAVKAWVKEFKPSQFFAKWQADSSMWKDDSVEIWYVS